MKFFILTMLAYFVVMPLAHAGKEPVYDRILRTKEIRCGYFIEYPLTIKNVNSGKMEGIVPELTELLASDLGFKIIWAEEMNASTMIEGLNTGRYDALCAGIMVMPSRAYLMEHATPFVFTPLAAYVRTDDRRFDNDIFKANTKGHKIIGLDGSGKTLMAVKAFGKADILMLPQFSSFAELFMNVADKKADMTFTIPSEFYQYNEHNPGILKQAGLFSVIPLSFAFRQGEVELKNMIDTVFSTYIADGRLEKIIRKHEKYPNSFYRVERPYEVRE